MKRGISTPNPISDLLILEMLSSDSFLIINKKLLATFGPENAVFISNLLDKVKYFVKEKIIESSTDWFYLTHEHQMLDINIKNEKALRKCKEFFKDEGILKTKMAGQPAKEMYKIQFAFLWKKINSALPKQGGLALPKQGGLALPKQGGLLYKENKNKNNKNKGSWTSLVSEYGREEVKFAKWFLMTQKKNWPNFIKEKITADCKRIQSSLICLDKLCRIDNYDFKKDIRPILKQVPEHDFWSRQILSLSTLRHRSKNGETKFSNICVDIHIPSEIIAPQQQLIDWYTLTRQKPSDAEMSRLRNSDKSYEKQQAERWSMIPTPKKLVEAYEAWLKQQDWINIIVPSLFKPTNGAFLRFLTQYQKDLGINLITGKHI